MTLRIVHLSDVHFGCENADAVAAASRFVCERPADLVVVSGDITQVGAHDEFKAAAAWLASLPGPCLTTPGNHDTPFWGLAERVVAPFERYVDAIGPCEDAGFEADGLRVHGFNSARGWQVRLNWSKGHVSRRQARTAARRLGAAPAGAVRVLVCHHPLVEARGEPITSRVRGGNAAARRMVDAGVDVVLSGHLHVPFVQAYPYGDERTYAVGAGTLSQRERGAPPGFNLVEIADSQLTVSAMALTGQALTIARTWSLPLRPRGAGGGAA